MQSRRDWLASLQQDLHAAHRLVWRARGFTAAAVLTLALGMAGTIVMFALIHGVLLRPLPVVDQDRLILAWKETHVSAEARYPFGNREIEAVAAASTLLDSAAGVTRNGVARTVVTDRGVSHYANVALVTGGFFDVLGVQPVLGRTLSMADDFDTAERVVVISSGYWQRRYGGARDVIGRRIALSERPSTVIGVMPPDLDYPSGVEMWTTTSSVPTDGPFGDAARREVNLIGRLRPGVTLAQASSELTALSARVDAETPAVAARALTPVVRPFADVVVGDVRRTMIALFAAVVLVLLIACANVANLLLLRGETRRGELAVRIALGAGRGRIVRQVLAESVVLALLAGGVGLFVAWSSVQAIVALVPDGLPRVESVRIDQTVGVFAAAVAMAAALLSGLVPGLSVGVNLLSPLHLDSRGIAVGATSGRRLLVVAQVALAVTVLAAAGLLIRSVLKLESIDLGLPAERLVLLDLHLPRAKYADRQRHARFLEDAMAGLEALPAIASATPINVAPFTDRGWDVPRATAEGQSADDAVANPSLNLESIHPNYFATFEVPMLRGRAFTTADREGGAPVAIVSADLAAWLWPQQDPIGKRLKMSPPTAAASWLEVVGVAADTRYRTVTTTRPTLYRPAPQFQMTATMLVVRTSASLDLLVALAADRIRGIDPDVQIMRAAPFTALLDRPLARPRFSALLLSLFGITALLLAVVGLYAVIAASVRQRTREIAVRMALGATGADVRRLVLADALTLAVAGAIVGVMCAALASRLLRGLLYEVDPLDPLPLAGAAALLVAAAALASYAPLRRVARADVAPLLRSQ
jgi:predicted permease